MTDHLLQIHIGPMQAFIAAARRTRDLWFGSWLMSELSKAAALGVAKLEGETSLIFPAASLAELAPGTDLGVSNKITARVLSPQDAATAAQEALQKRYRQLITATSMKKFLTETAWDRAQQQLENFLEFYWVSFPMDKGYKYARDYTDALLSARKNTRSFSRVTWDGTGLPKSSLNGRMETVTPQPPDNNQDTAARLQYARLMYQQFKARPGEQLSGVDLLKRLGQGDTNDQAHFPSTSHMAAMPLKAKLAAVAASPKVKSAWQDYLETLSDEVKKQEIIYLSNNLRLPILDDLDGALLFDSRLLDFMEKGETTGPRNKLNTFLKEAGIDSLIPYYALLVGDGDSIGDHISQQTSPEAHRAFSAQLAAFSQQARKIVADHDGAVVYAGGDDVLALLPLHTAVSTAAKLAATFKQMMQGPTFSVGIAIVHHLEPLEDGLKMARDTEKEAKAIPGKDALAITLNKRSGAPRTITGKWGELDDRLLAFAAWHQKGAIPDGLAYQLRDVYLRLGENNALIDIYMKEAGRIIGRKRRDDGEEMLTDTVRDQLVDAVTAVGGNLQQLSSELIIAAHIAQAQIPAPEEAAP